MEDGRTVWFVGDDVTAPVQEKDDWPTFIYSPGNYALASIGFQAVLNENGAVEFIEFDDVAPSDMDARVAYSMLRWRFKPATRNGQPVPVIFRGVMEVKHEAHDGKFEIEIVPKK